MSEQTQIIEALKQAISADPLQFAPDGKGPIDEVILKAKTNPDVFDTYRSFIASEEFVRFAASSTEHAHSCRHLVRQLGLSSALNAAALRRSLKASTQVATRAMLLFMLRDRGALPSFAEVSEDKQLFESTPGAWIDLVAGLVTPERLCELLKDGVNQKALPPNAVVFAFPRLRTAFGNNFVPLMSQLVKDLIHPASKLLSDGLNERYGIGIKPSPAHQPPLSNIGYLGKSREEKDQRLQLANRN